MRDQQKKPIKWELRPEELQLIIDIRDAERSGVSLLVSTYGATLGLLQACKIALGTSLQQPPPG